MSYRVTADDVRKRLRNIPEVTVTDGDMLSPSFIPLAEAKIDQWLEDNGLTYAGLSATKKILLVYAEILLCCIPLLTDAPIGDFDGGIVSFGAISSTDRKTVLDSIKGELLEILNTLGIKRSQNAVGGNTSGGDDYLPDGVDNRNINWSDENVNAWSLFP